MVLLLLLLPVHVLSQEVQKENNEHSVSGIIYVTGDAIIINEDVSSHLKIVKVESETSKERALLAKSISKKKRSEKNIVKDKKLTKVFPKVKQKYFITSSSPDSQLSAQYNRERFGLIIQVCKFFTSQKSSRILIPQIPEPNLLVFYYSVIYRTQFSQYIWARPPPLPS